MQHSINDTYHCQRLGFSSSASPQSTEKESKQSLDDGASVKENGASENAEPTKTNGEATASEKKEESGKTTACLLMKKPLLTGYKYKVYKAGNRGNWIAFRGSDSDEELSIDDLVKLVTEKEELLKQKHKEIEVMQDKVLRSYAEMENVMDRTRREAENSKKFAIQVGA